MNVGIFDPMRKKFFQHGRAESSIFEACRML